jgi:acetoin utilization protein AcuB
MRVSKWMSPKVITLQASDSISTAIHLMKEKRIRRIPIVNGGGKLVGIVSDRDLKDVSPSRATTLDIWELHAVLDKRKSPSR